MRQLWQGIIWTIVGAVMLLISGWALEREGYSRLAWCAIVLGAGLLCVVAFIIYQEM